MEEGLLIKLIEFIEQASPQIWAIAQRQVYVGVIQNIFWAFLCAASCPILIWLAKNRWQVHMDDRYSMVPVCLWASVIMLGVLTATLCSLVIGPIVNPQYYAISTLIDLIK